MLEVSDADSVQVEEEVLLLDVRVQQLSLKEVNSSFITGEGGYALSQQSVGEKWFNNKP